MTERNGVTPVISVVLLMMLTVAIAGGAYTWVDGMVQDRFDQTRNELNTQLEFKDITCDATTDEVGFYIKNTGSTTVDLAQVDVYLYQISDGRLADDASLSDTDNLEPGGSWSTLNGDVSPIAFSSADLQSGRKYRLEFSFNDASNHEVTATCRAS